jgi:glycosyltransferase involved in cell wall biosynthesis
MHICYITSEYPIRDFSHGGVGTFTRTLGYKLIEKGIRVSVIRLSNVEKEEVILDDGIHVYLIPEERKLPLKFLWNSIKINKVIKKIHSRKPISIIETPELGLAFLKKLDKIKYCIRMHGGHHFFAKAENRPTEWKKVWQEKRSFKKADCLIAVSNYVAETTKNLLQLDHQKIEVIYNPIDTQRFYLSNNNKIETHTIFFAGTIIEKKGIRQLIESLEYLVDDFPNIKLKIAGKFANLPGTSISYQPILEKSISNKIKKHIEFLGSIPNFEIPKYIEKANICCYPSHMEAMPIAWLEVLSMGKIFIGSNTGPGPEAVEDNVTGFLVNPFNPFEIALKIKYAFENETECIKKGNEARNTIIENFQLEKLVFKNIDFYESLIQNNENNTRNS